MKTVERLRATLAQATEIEPQLPVGSIFGDYEIGPLIAAGGMGEVYRGHHRRLDRPVAIKMVGRKSRFDPQAVARLQREAKLAASIAHPNLVTLYEIIDLDGRFCLVFELLKGETLRSRLLRGNLSLDDGALLGEQMARGLAALHAAGVTHSDIKPGNIFLCDRHVVKLLDMGIARPVLRAEDETKTGQALLGTPSYMSPERIRSGTHAPAGDVFCLGVVIHEALTGEHPFRQDDVEGTLHAIVNQAPGPGNLPESMTRLISSCLEKDPNLRPSAEEVADALSAIRSGRDPRIGGRGPSVARRVAVGAVLVAIVVAMTGWWWQGGESASQSTSQRAVLTARPLPSPSPEVYRMYLDAEGLVDLASPDSLSRAKVLLEQIIDRAPDFAAGWASYANLLQMISAFVDGVDPAKSQPQAMDAARRALRLDPDLAGAHQAMADLLARQNDWIGAEAAIRRALDLNPGAAEVHHSYAISVLVPTGRLDQAERESLRAVEIQPSSGIYGEALGRVYYFKGDLVTALDQWTRVLVRHPRELASLWRKGLAEALLGRPLDALKTFALANSFTPGIHKGQALIAFARARAGDLEGARAIRDRLLAVRQKGGYVAPLLLGVIEVGLGDADAAFPHLMAACEAHADWIRFAKVDPILDPIRGDERFGELLRCLKLDPAKRP